MKIIFERYICILGIAIALLATVSCEKAETPEGAGKAIIEQLGNFIKVSSSIALPEGWPTNFETDSIQVNLSGNEDWEVIYSFWLSFNAHNDILDYKMYLPADNIPKDGEYRVASIFTPDGKRHYNRMMVTMGNSCMVRATVSTFDYKPLKGSGTVDDPYRIESITSLISFSSRLQKDPMYGYGIYFILGSDIEMAKYYEDPGRVMDQGWCGIGGKFAGILNGNGYTVNDLEHNDPGAGNIGLFQHLADGAQIQNLTLNGVNITAAGNNVGALAGYASGTVTLNNVTVIGNINASGNNVGGIIGYSDDSLIFNNCVVSSGTISGTGNSYGGFLGRSTNGAVFVNCRNKGMNVYTTGNEAGGFVGHGANGQYTDNIQAMNGTYSSTGTVHAKEMAGGIAGYSMRGIFKNIYVRANSIIAEDKYCGGLAGYNKASLTIENCVVFHSSSPNYKENIIGKSTTCNTGGFAGYCGNSENALKITDSEVCTPVTGKDNVGGMIGQSQKADIEIRNCINSSSSQIYGNSKVGGFIGYLNSSSADIAQNDQRCNVTGAGEYTGGIIGHADTKVSIKETLVNCNISGGGKYTGGLAGFATGLTISKIEFGSGVTVNGPHDVGGIAGRLENSTIQQPFDGEFEIIINNNEQVASKSISAGGIAGSASGCTIKDITVHCSVYGKQYVGGITGYDDNSTYGKCIFQGAEVKGMGSSEYVGGIVGYVYTPGSLVSLTNKGKVTGNSRTGGIAGGLRHCGISQSTNEGTVQGGQDTGGIVGYIIHDSKENGEAVTVSECINKGTVTASKRCLGGICGYLETGKAKNGYVSFKLCFNDASGKVIGTGTGSGDRDGMGGIIGEGKYSFEAVNCGNRGTVEGSAGFHHIGGIAGYMGRNSYGYDNYLKIDECYNTGNVYVTGNSNDVFVGGIAGHLEDAATTERQVMVTDCFNRGKVTARSSGQDNAGGIVGKASFYITIKKCYSAGKVCSDGHGSKLSNGIAGTHADGEVLYGTRENIYVEKDTGKDWWGKFFKYEDRGNQKTYGGFNFSGGTWAISSSINGGYPYLPRTPMQ